MAGVKLTIEDNKMTVQNLIDCSSTLFSKWPKNTATYKNVEKLKSILEEYKAVIDENSMIIEGSGATITHANTKRKRYYEALKQLQAASYWDCIINSLKGNISQEKIKKIEGLKKYCTEMPNEELETSIKESLAKISLLEKASKQVLQLIMTLETTLIDGVSENKKTGDLLFQIEDYINKSLCKIAESLLWKMRPMLRFYEPSKINDSLPYIITQLDSLGVKHKLPYYSISASEKISPTDLSSIMRAITQYAGGQFY